MDGGMSNISCQYLTILHPCDERFRGFVLGDYFNTKLSADNSYGNYHKYADKYYLSKCVIVRNGLIYLIDGKKTITIRHDYLRMCEIIYEDDAALSANKITIYPANEIFGEPIKIANPDFKKMYHDVEYLKFYENLMTIVLERDVAIYNRFMCGICIKKIATVKLSCGHTVYCKDCFSGTTCCVCLRTGLSAQPTYKTMPLIDLSAFE
jgi:hypothetical protein